jgi:hypothetical protein
VSDTSPTWKTHRRPWSSFAAGDEAGATVVDFEPRSFADGTDPKGKRAAAIGVQRPVRIMSGLDQKAAK